MHAFMHMYNLLYMLVCVCLKDVYYNTELLISEELHLLILVLVLLIDSSAIYICKLHNQFC